MGMAPHASSLRDRRAVLGVLEEVVFRCCLVSPPVGGGQARRLHQTGASHRRQDLNPHIWFWRPALYQLSYGDRCGVVDGGRATRKPTVCRRAYGGLVVYEGLIPLHEVHLPAAKDARVLGGPLTVRRLLRSIERAVPGIRRQRQFDAVHGLHGRFFRLCCPRSEASPSGYTDPLTCPTVLCGELFRGCGSLGLSGCTRRARKVRRAVQDAPCGDSAGRPRRARDRLSSDARLHPDTHPAASA